MDVAQCPFKGAAAQPARGKRPNHDTADPGGRVCEGLVSLRQAIGSLMIGANATRRWARAQQRRARRQL